MLWPHGSPAGFMVGSSLIRVEEESEQTAVGLVWGQSGLLCWFCEELSEFRGSWAPCPLSMHRGCGANGSQG